MYGLTPEDLELQARARGFADELIPHEQYAEEHGGELPDGRRAPARGPGRSSSGLTATNIPIELGGRGCTHAAAGAGAGAGRPGHQRARLVPDHAARAGGPRSPTTTSARPTCSRPSRARREECYAITEEYAGSDVSDLKATAARDGDDYVLNGVKWHVTSYNKADYVFFQARADRRRPRRRAGAVRRRQRHPGHPGGAHPGVHPHHRPPPPDRGVRGRPGPGHPPDRRARATGCPSSTSGSASSG